jgi:uncharacterized membrane protein YeaQ/YmgE (transglycosylase-associated protein family)
MGVLSWLVVGLVAGFIGSKVVNRTGEGLVRDIILGILGAVVGDAIFTQLGYVGVTGVNLASIGWPRSGRYLSWSFIMRLWAGAPPREAAATLFLVLIGLSTSLRQ